VPYLHIVKRTTFVYILYLYKCTELLYSTNAIAATMVVCNKADPSFRSMKIRNVNSLSHGWHTACHHKQLFFTFSQFLGCL